MVRSVWTAGAALLILGAAASAQVAMPAPATQTQPASVAETVEALARAMEENFFFPEAGARYASALRQKLSAGAYAGLTDAAVLAQTLTDDLQAIHPDRHVRVMAPGVGIPGMRVGGRPGGTGGLVIEGVKEAGWIADGIAYINFGAFPGDPENVEKVRRFLAEHADARAVIFDLRQHRGGTLTEMEAIFPALFAQETELVRMDTRAAVEQRQGSPLADGPTLRRLPSPDSIVRRSHWAVPSGATGGLASVPVYLLTSRRTASAAEHFALALKRTNRATLIGEQTAGAGHYGGLVPLPGGYSAFVPVGRTYDPLTNEGWEATGVAPDVKVPADDALDEALRRLGIDPAQKRQI